MMNTHRSNHSHQQPIDLASSEEFSYNVEAYRAEILSDGYVDEHSTGYDLPARGVEETRQQVPEQLSRQQQNPDPNAAYVFRRFLGSRSGPTMPTNRGLKSRESVAAPARPSLFDATDTISDASAETEVMGSTGRTSSGSEIGSTFDFESTMESVSSSQQFKQFMSPKTPPIPEGAVARHGIASKTKSMEVVSSVEPSVQPGNSKMTFGWRLDPTQSFSDWEIKIVTESGETEQYHVHRMALAAGPRKSEYFTDLFGRQVQSFKNQRLRLEMPDESAKVFPKFLDFVYGENDLESVEEKKEAYTIYEQAEFFETPLLKKAVANWCKKRLQWFNVPGFLPELDRFENADPLVRMAVDLCAANFEELGTDFGAKIEPKYLQMIFENLKERGFKFDRGTDYIAEMILEACNVHVEMDEETFLGLTDMRFLPSVPVESVLRILAAEKSFSSDTDSEASLLQSRCITSLSENWEYFSFQFPSKEDMAVAMMSLPKHIMSQLLVLTTSLP